MQNRKLTIGIAVFVTFFCCLSAVLGVVVMGNLGRSAMRNIMITDSRQAAAIGHQILDYDLPAGYAERLASNVGYKMVAISRQGGGMVIMLMQFPEMGMSRDEMEKQMQRSMAQQGSGSGITWGPPTERTLVIKGRETVLTARTGTDNRGALQRQETATTQGKGGVVMIMVMGDDATWDGASLDAFLTSIR